MTACSRVPQLFALLSYLGNSSAVASLALLCWLANVHSAHAQGPSTAQSTTNVAAPANNQELATFGGGCFWCTEAVFENVPGVIDVVSGFSGGKFPNPSYKQVLTGQTGHAEVSQITFDPSRVTYLELLELFMKTHDPTSLNKQGRDIGTQYRSVIFYHSDEQKQAAEKLIEKLQVGKASRNKIVTQVTPYAAFYPAEDYHQDYFRKNPTAEYCQNVVRPKVNKSRRLLQEIERKEAAKDASKDKEPSKDKDASKDKDGDQDKAASQANKRDADKSAAKSSGKAAAVK